MQHQSNLNASNVLLKSNLSMHIKINEKLTIK